MQLYRGDQIGSFVIQEKLASTILSNIYIARHYILGGGMEAIVKELTDPDLKRIFFREANLLSIASSYRLSVPLLYDYLECNNTQYIVMEYIRGKSLFDLTRQKQLEQSQVINIGIQLCDLYSRLHEDLSIVHRDGNLNNVFISKPQGKVVLLDFGNAITMDSEDEQVQLATDHFAAPEFRRGKCASLQTLDIFAIGAILFSICFPPLYKQGSMYVPHPLQPFHEKELMYHLNILGVNPELKEIILKAIKYNPAERYQSAREMRKDLESASGTLLLSS